MSKKADVIVDIGSASVGVALVGIGEKGRPSLSMVRRTPLQGGSTSRSDLGNAVRETLKQSLEGIQKSGTVKSVHVVLASPWYQAHLKTLVSKSEKSISISKGTVAATVRAYHEKKEQGSMLSGSVVESVVTQAYVNGYQTLIEKPVHGQALKIELYESSAETELLTSLTKTIEEVFHGAKITFHSFPLIAFVVLRSLRSEEGFTFVDIGGEVTDIAIVHKDGLRFLGSFPRGTNALIADLGGSKERSETVSRLSLYTKGELSTEEGASFAAAFQKSATAWNEEYQHLMEAAVADVPIPRTAFIIADREELKWFEKVINQDGTKTFPVYPITLKPDFFQSTIELGDSGIYDAFLSLEAIFFHTEQKELIELKKGQ